MIDFSGQTYQAILTQMLSRIPDTYDKRDTSPIPTALGPAAWSLEGFYLSRSLVCMLVLVTTEITKIHGTHHWKDGMA